MHMPKNALENYGLNYDFVLICVQCKMLFTSVFWRWVGTFLGLGV